MFDSSLPEFIHQFNAHLDDLGGYDLIQLPSGEYVSMAEVYLMMSPTQYFKDMSAWLLEQAGGL